MSYTGVHPLRRGSPWRLQLEGQLRQSPGARAPQGRLLRTALLHSLGASTSAGVGYAYSRNHPFGEYASDPIPIDEHRTWQQVETGHRSGPVVWNHRYRLEQRWLQRTDADTTGTPRIADTRLYVNRARYQLRTTAGPDATPTGRGIYGTAHNEVFIAFGQNVRGNVFDQNRFFVGPGYRWGAALRAEAGYLNQYVMRGSGRAVDRLHTVLVALASDLPLF